MSIRPRKKSAVSLTQAEAFDVILRPIITEKATMQAENNQFGFVVAVSATKPQIKAAIELLYKVKVEAVNTSILKGKTRMFRGIKGRRMDRKKAIVTLAEGQSVDIMQGV